MPGDLRLLPAIACHLRPIAARHTQVTTSSEGLSAVYAVLGRRRARILREEMREGSDLFSIHAYLPAEASFGFADELRRRSSGAATASLMLSHWERLQVRRWGGRAARGAARRPGACSLLARTPSA